MRSLFSAIRQWWYAWTGQPGPHEAVFVSSDPPQSMRPNFLYVITEDDLPWHASMLCPCGCGAELHLNLLPDDRPCWRLKHHWDGMISLHPSVWRVKGCRSHFWFKRGRVHWTACPDAQALDHSTTGLHRNLYFNQSDAQKEPKSWQTRR